MLQLPAAFTSPLSWSSTWLLFLSVFNLRARAVLPVSESVTICSMTEIALLRACGQCCLVHCTGYCNGLDELDVVLGCEANSATAKPKPNLWLYRICLAA
jgi:hypothetical protein